MSINADANLKQAVESFSWDDPIDGGMPIPDNDFNQLVTQIFKDIVTVSEIIPGLQDAYEEKLSLSKTCYLITQEEERESSVLECINQASPSTKIILNYAFKILSNQFINTPSDELQSSILLLGIEMTTKLVSKTMESAEEDIISKVDLQS